MKKFICILLALWFMLFCALAEDYSAMNTEALEEKRRELYSEITKINMILGQRIKEESTVNSDEALGKIIDLFPDEALAKLVRDEVAKFSIEQTVTEKDLEKVETIWGTDEHINDLTGIGLLKNLKKLSLFGKYDGETLPEEMKNCRNLKYLTLSGNDNLKEIPKWIGELHELKSLELGFLTISSIPESIGNLQKLEELRLLYCENLKALPDSIGNCISLKTLILSDTSISSLPSSIGNCVSLKTLDISDTKINSLPDSIWSLTLEKIDMSGTAIR